MGDSAYNTRKKLTAEMAIQLHCIKCKAIDTKAVFDCRYNECIFYHYRLPRWQQYLFDQGAYDKSRK